MCLVEARPSVQIIFFLRFAVGVVLAAHGLASLSGLRLLDATLAWELTIVFVYLLNGVHDVVEDRVNGSGRPIARGDLSPVVAARVAYGCAIAGLAAALVLGISFFALVTSMLILGYLYSAPRYSLKIYTWSTAVIVCAAGMLSYDAGSVVVGGHLISCELIVFGIVMSAWMGAVGAVVKDFSDVGGDVAAGRRTVLARGGGEDRRCRRSVSAAAVGLGGAFVVVATLVARPLLVPAVVLFVGAAALAVVTLGRHSHGSRRSRRRPYRAFMVTQHAVHLALVVVAVVPFA